MKSQFTRQDMEQALEDRVGEFSGIRQIMRERLNKKGDSDAAHRRSSLHSRLN
jgi:hypothetical protein